MLTLNEVERLGERSARLAAYAELVAREPDHSFAWCNYAVDLAADGDWLAARRAALTAAGIDGSLRTRGPASYRDLLTLGEIALVGEVVATARHVLYRGVRAGDGQPVLVRCLPDVAVAQATSVFGHHEVLTRVRSVPHVVRALGTVTGADGQLYQVLEHVRGDVLWNLFHLPLPPRAAVVLVADVARALAGARAAEVESFDLRPEFLLRAEDPEVGVVSLGPLERRGDALWLAPEERDGRGGVPSDVLRLGLLLYASTGAELPTPRWDGERGLAAPVAWGELPTLHPWVVRATAIEVEARPSLDELVAALQAITTAQEAPRELGGLRLLRLLGDGRFARVWAGEDRDGAVWAVKVLRPQVASDGELRLRFLNEARIAGRIDHPGVIKVAGAGVTDGGEHYLVMELATGGTLADRLAAGPLTVAQTVDVGIQVAEAMAAVHGHAIDGLTIIHRDLKPSNLMLVAADGARLTVKVADFGVAKLAGEPTEAGLPLTRTGRVLGTPAYMAPEQWRMIDDLDPRADIYALGAVLYHCLTGAPPFAGKNDYELQQLHLYGALPPLTERGVPAALAAVVERMLAKDRDDRPVDMRAVADALRACRAAAPVKDPPKEPSNDPTKDPTEDPTKDPTEDPTKDPTEDPHRRPRSRWRKPLRVALVGAPLAAAVVAAVVVARQRATSPVTVDAAPAEPEPPPANPCGHLVKLEWDPVRRCGAGEHQVWLLDDAGRCVRALYDVPALGRELAAIVAAGAPGTPAVLRALPRGLSLRDERGRLVVVDRDGNLPGGVTHLVFVSYLRSTGARRFGLSVDDSEPIFLSATGVWCDARRVPLARAASGPP